LKPSLGDGSRDGILLKTYRGQTAANIVYDKIQPTIQEVNV